MVWTWRRIIKMGMFDNVRFEMKCPVCGNPLNNFQCKDEEGSGSLITLDYWEVDNFYDRCDKCESWIEFFRDERVKSMKEPKGFRMIIFKKGEAKTFPSVYHAGWIQPK